jgi:hypothetical protein
MPPLTAQCPSRMKATPEKAPPPSAKVYPGHIPTDDEGGQRSAKNYPPRPILVQVYGCSFWHWGRAHRQANWNYRRVEPVLLHQGIKASLDSSAQVRARANWLDEHLEPHCAVPAHRTRTLAHPSDTRMKLVLHNPETRVAVVERRTVRQNRTRLRVCAVEGSLLRTDDYQLNLRDWNPLGVVVVYQFDDHPPYGDVPVVFGVTDLPLVLVTEELLDQGLRGQETSPRQKNEYR